MLFLSTRSHPVTEAFLQPYHPWKVRRSWSVSAQLDMGQSSSLYGAYNPNQKSVECDTNQSTPRRKARHMLQL